jgi:hypothetical protein
MKTGQRNRYSRHLPDKIKDTKKAWNISSFFLYNNR